MFRFILYIIYDFKKEIFVIDKSKLKPIEGEERIRERDLPEVSEKVDECDSFEIS